MGFTIKEKVFLLDYFRKRVKQESEDKFLDLNSKSQSLTIKHGLHPLLLH
jgi:hypothetical protein